ncbi:MAG: (2Fe-2S)-binding protein [Marinisporobacter sp.]|jgi:NAD(P)H-nitrite reductase large subunit|nr:(2Fe-2S)-binding protein [Marinisporobacter sp.]
MEAIESGDKTVEEVNNKTGADSSGCGGKRCGVKIKEMLEEYRRD